MAIEAVFLNLTSAFAAMRDALHSLSLTAIEDRPPRDQVLLVERLGNVAEDLRGWTEEGHASASAAHQAVAHPPDLHRGRHALGIAHERFILLEYRFFEEGVAYHMIDGLLRFGRQRGGEWQSWSTSVVEALDGCRAPLRALDEALLQAWLELGERLGSRSLSLQTTNIGQQISAMPGNAQAAAPRAGGVGTESGNLHRQPQGQDARKRNRVKGG